MAYVKKYLKWIILGIFVFIFAFVVHELLSGSLSGFDNIVYSFIIGFKSSFLTYFFLFISFMASPPTLVVISLLLFIIFKNKKYGLLSFCNLIFIVLLNQALKLFFSRERPFAWMIVNEDGFSFPSGHAMVSSAFYGIVIYLIWKTNVSKKRKIILTSVLSLLILLIGISRIYLGVHYASDVIAGFTLSLSYVIIATSLIDYYLSKRKKAS
ncbi:MAG: phosphatase PAP2 family protein [Bacilli bacterium]|nr:phosphatase PAP2 family protein [Bacilli bacterium]